VEVRLPGSSVYIDATLNRIHDQSMYTVGEYYLNEWMIRAFIYIPLGSPIWMHVWMNIQSMYTVSKYYLNHIWMNECSERVYRWWVLYECMYEWIFKACILLVSTIWIIYEWMNVQSMYTVSKYFLNHIWMNECSEHVYRW